MVSLAGVERVGTSQQKCGIFGLSPSGRRHESDSLVFCH